MWAGRSMVRLCLLPRCSSAGHHYVGMPVHKRHCNACCLDTFHGTVMYGCIKSATCQVVLCRLQQYGFKKLPVTHPCISSSLHRKCEIMRCSKLDGLLLLLAHEERCNMRNISCSYRSPHAVYCGAYKQRVFYC